MNADTSVMVKPTMSIGELCARTGTTPRMIRHYEKAGILTARREPNGYRAFSEADVTTIVDARCLIEAGLSATETAELVGIVCGENAARADLADALALIHRRRAKLEERIAALISARAKLDELRDHVANASLPT